MQSLEAIQSLILAGKVKQAEQELEALAAEQPAMADDPAWHVLCAQVHFHQNAYPQAATHFRQAVKAWPQDSALHNNLAESLKRSGETAQAERIWQQLIQQQPEYTLARYNLACLHVQQGQGGRALEALGPPEAEESAQWQAVRGDAFRLLGKPAKARHWYEQALQQDADCFQALTNLGPLLLTTGQYEQAQKHCQRACELRPEHGLAWFNLGRCHLALDDFESALEAFAHAYQRIPDFMPLVRAITRCWLDMGDFREVEAWLQELKTLPGSEDEVAVLEIRLLREREQYEQALEQAEAFLQQHPEHAAMSEELAQVLEADGQLQAAEAIWRRRIEQSGHQPQLWQALGHVLEVAGDLKQAEQAFYQALQINPNSIPALSGLASLLRKKLPAEQAERMQAHLQNERLGKRPRASLHNGLAYWYDGQGQYDLACEHADQANQHYWQWRTERGWEYDPDTFSKQVDEFIELFDAQWFEQLRQPARGSEDPRPVFIVGMPRSGTTMTEQMLAAHPHIAGVGEAPFASRGFWRFVEQRPAELDVHQAMLQAPDGLQSFAHWHLQQLEKLVNKQGEAEARRIVDKMPDNYVLVPWLRALFPQGKIIHLRRDPRDVAVSCWMTQFGQIRWAFDQAHLARRIEDYLRLTQHWQQVMGDQWLEVDYEAVVEQPQQQLQRMLDWLELDFHPDCLAFHKQRKAVRTASISQVRQPLYKSSTQRWRRYEPYLGSLFQQIEQAMRQVGRL